MTPDRPVWFGLPRDNFGWIALVCALLCFVAYFVASDRLNRIARKTWALLFAFIAFGLSVAYVHFYLRGGPRIIDATSYWLEAKAISHGFFSWDVPEPSACFRGRFLLHQAIPGQASHLSVIFPPGYPVVLAIGMALGLPMLVGPIIAFLLVILTDRLAMELSDREDVARLAVVFSAFCATLRYHTADTMSHGLSALALGTSVLFALRALRATPNRALILWLSSGAFFGLLGATRPFSAAALACVGLVALLTKRTSLKSFVALSAGAFFPLLLLLFHHHAATGHWLRSTQSAYYLLSDGPPGCFRYGFGKGIGCLVEHGSYVNSVLPKGFGIWEALHTTVRRLRQHAVDLANFEPLALLGIFGIWVGRSSPRIMFASAIPAALVFAYLPFYFDGSYPGGGARFFVDALPFAHVVMALALAEWSVKRQYLPRALPWAVMSCPFGAARTPASPRRALERTAASGSGERLSRKSQKSAAAFGLAGLMFAGFAFRASHEHRLLRDRDGARPLFEASVVKAAIGESKGLMWVDTDHAFNLAHDPSVIDAQKGLVVARMRFDDRDRLLWESLGRPESWRYIFHPWEKDALVPHITPWRAKDPEGNSFSFEAESEWPPLEQSGGYAVPTYLAPDSCVSSGKALALIRTEADQAVCVTVDVPTPDSGSFELRPWLVVDGNASISAEYIKETGEHDPWSLGEGLKVIGESYEKSVLDGRYCVGLPAKRVDLSKGTRGKLRICSKEPWIAVDRVTVVGPAAKR